MEHKILKLECPRILHTWEYKILSNRMNQNIILSPLVYAVDIPRQIC